VPETQPANRAEVVPVNWDTLTALSQWVIPLFPLLLFLPAWVQRVPVYAVFVEGAQDGFALVVRLIPYVVEN